MHILSEYQIHKSSRANTLSQKLTTRNYNHDINTSNLQVSCSTFLIVLNAFLHKSLSISINYAAISTEKQLLLLWLIDYNQDTPVTYSQPYNRGTCAEHFTVTYTNLD